MIAAAADRARRTVFQPLGKNARLGGNVVAFTCGFLFTGVMMAGLGVQCRSCCSAVLGLRLLQCLGGAKMCMRAIKFGLQLIAPPDQTLPLKSIALRSSKGGGLFLECPLGLLLIQGGLVMPLLRTVQSAQSLFMLREALG